MKPQRKYVLEAQSDQNGMQKHLSAKVMHAGKGFLIEICFNTKVIPSKSTSSHDLKRQNSQY